jgi:hypothetical protein
MTAETRAVVRAEAAEGAAQCTRDTQVLAWRNNMEQEVQTWQAAQEARDTAAADADADGKVPEDAEPPSADPPLGPPPLCALPPSLRIPHFSCIACQPLACYTRIEFSPCMLQCHQQAVTKHVNDKRLASCHVSRTIVVQHFGPCTAALKRKRLLAQSAWLKKWSGEN